MNKRDTAILEWVRKNRPDILPSLEEALRNVDNPSVAILAIGFEAGRQFQVDNPTLELDNPNVY